MTVRIIGLGGIGSHLAAPLCRYLDALADTNFSRVILMDGDRYEAKNANRQEFPDLGNKAEVTRDRLRVNFPDLVIEAKPQYVTEENVFLAVNSGDLVFLAVDNHATRKLVSEHCETLQDVVLISGGNEFTDGNVQMYVRRGGQNLTPPLTYLRPEIENPEDRNPAEMSCEELAALGSPQLIFTNLTASALMLNAFWVIREFLSGNVALGYTEQYFDLTTGMVRSLRREEKE